MLSHLQPGALGGVVDADERALLRGRGQQLAIQGQRQRSQGVAVGPHKSRALHLIQLHPHLQQAVSVDTPTPAADSQGLRGSHAPWLACSTSGEMRGTSWGRVRSLDAPIARPQAGDWGAPCMLL